METLQKDVLEVKVTDKNHKIQNVEVNDYSGKYKFVPV